jgi:hypothetical protein
MSELSGGREAPSVPGEAARTDDMPSPAPCGSIAHGAVRKSETAFSRDQKRVQLGFGRLSLSEHAEASALSGEVAPTMVAQPASMTSCRRV